MTGNWAVFKWSVVIAALLFCLLLSFALGYFWRDKRERKKIGNFGLAVMLVCTLQSAIQDVFENVYATRAAYIVLGIAVLGVSVLLTRLLVLANGNEIVRGDDEAEHLQSLRLS